MGTLCWRRRSSPASRHLSSRGTATLVLSVTNHRRDGRTNRGRAAGEAGRVGAADRTRLRDGELQLSFAQQRLWFFDQFEPQTFAYNMPAAVRYRGELNVPALERAFNEIARRHEVLRTTFLNVDGRPCQIIHHDAAFKIDVIDLSDMDVDEREGRAQQLATEEARRPFNLAADMMLRVTVVRLDVQDHAVLLTMHHIASDGWSMGILLSELTTFYDAYCKSEEATLPPLRCSMWTMRRGSEWLQGEVLEEQTSYWKQRLGDGSPVLQLPLDKPRPFLQTYNGARQRFFVSSTVSEKAKDARKAGRDDAVHDAGGGLSNVTLSLYRPGGHQCRDASGRPYPARGGRTDRILCQHVGVADRVERRPDVRSC